jgi:hypothetical protein
VAGRTRLLALAAAFGTAAALAVAALAAPGDPKHAFKPADQAYAKTLLLRKADVHGKGWSGKPTDFGRENPPCLVAHYSLSKLTATAEAGTTFTRAADTGTFLVESDVHVFVTAAQASKAVTITSQVGLGRCLASELVNQVPSGSFATSQVKSLTISGLAAPARGFTIILHIVSSQGKSTLTAPVISLRRGRTLVVLSLLTLDKGWSQADIRAAATTLASRLATRSV